VVAPRTPQLPALQYSEREAAAVVSALKASLLQGEVTGDQLITELQKGYDIVWFITHGDENGIALTNEFITASQLTQAVRSSRAKLIVLNTCSSHKVAARIHNELRTYLICTLRDVLDQNAYYTGRLLAAALGGGATFRAAFNAAIPGGNEDYLYFPGDFEEQGAMSPPPLRDTPPSGAGTPVTQEDLREMLERIDAIVFGSARWQIVGLVESNRILGEKVQVLTRELDTTKAEMKLTRETIRTLKIWLILISVLSVLMLVALFIQTFRPGGA
jgi:hypothetical protein